MDSAKKPDTRTPAKVRQNQTSFSPPSLSSLLATGAISGLTATICAATKARPHKRTQNATARATRTQAATSFKAAAAMAVSPSSGRQ